LLEAGAADEATVRNVLERLGPPEEIVAAAGPAQRRSGRLELAAMIALAIPFLGWFIGVVLVGASRAWTGREKAVGIAIVLVPALVLFLGLVAAGGDGGSTPVEAAPGAAARGSFPREQGGGSSGLGSIEVVVLLGTLFAGPIASVYLGSRLRRASEPAEIASA
jgi:hypothetical protein